MMSLSLFLPWCLYMYALSWMDSWPPFERMGKSESSFHLSQWGLSLFVVQFTHPSTMKGCSNSPCVVYKVPKGRFIICKKERHIAKVRMIPGTFPSQAHYWSFRWWWWCCVGTTTRLPHYDWFACCYSLSLSYNTLSTLSCLLSFRTTHSGKKCINKLHMPNNFICYTLAAKQQANSSLLFPFNGSTKALHEFPWTTLPNNQNPVPHYRLTTRQCVLQVEMAVVNPPPMRGVMHTAQQSGRLHTESACLF